MDYVHHFDLPKSGKRRDKGGKGGSGSKAGKKAGSKTGSKAGKRDAVDDDKNYGQVDSKKWSGVNEQHSNEGKAKSEKEPERGGAESKGGSNGNEHHSNEGKAKSVK